MTRKKAAAKKKSSTKQTKKADVELLDEALARGILSNEQRTQLAALRAEQATDNEERLKPVGTFNEIFVTVGTGVLLSALSGLVPLILGHVMAGEVVMVGLFWLTALLFHRGQRFRLPIVYCCLVGAVALGQLVVLLQIVDTGVALHEAPRLVIINGLGAALIYLAAGATRFRIPFLMLPIAVLFTIIITYIAKQTDDDLSLKLILGGCGLSILAAAVHFDLKDPRRLNRWSDFAFWSYIVGSPLFVHSLFLSILLHENKLQDLHSVNIALVAVLVLAVTFAGILINRRALILSTMLYVGFVIFRMLMGIEVIGKGTLLLLTLLVIGLYIIVLGARWARVRHQVMTSLPSWKWLKRLPPY